MIELTDEALTYISLYITLNTTILISFICTKYSKMGIVKKFFYLWVYIGLGINWLIAAAIMSLIIYCIVYNLVLLVAR